MLNDKKLKEIAKQLTANRNDFMQAFRNNLYLYTDDKEITVQDIVDKSGVPYTTLKTFLYRDTNDAKLSNAVKLARALEVSIDELIGAETIPQLSRESLRMCRDLPENDLLLVRWFIRYLDRLNQNLDPKKRYVSVMMPKMDNNGDFEITADYEKIEITELQEPLRSKVFMGFHIICDHYMPHYRPGDIIFIANDRPPKFNEHAVVRVGKYLFIIKRTVENGVAKYHSVRDGKFRIFEKEVDELIGYIGFVKNTKEQEG